MLAYVVQEGEHLAQIAARLGTTVDAIWNHDRNRELRELRTDPGVLASGDVLFVPEPTEGRVALDSQTTNRFRASAPRVRLDMVLTMGGPEPVCNEPYRIEGLAQPIEGQTDGEGHLRAEIPARVASIRIVIPRSGCATVVRVGRLDPPEGESGVRQRLAQLGYFVPSAMLGAEGGERPTSEDELRAAVTAFQHARRISESGVVDEATRDALREAHGR